MLADMLACLGEYPAYQAQYGTDTDIVIAANGLQAILKAVEAELTVYYWDSSADQPAPVGMAIPTRKLVERVLARNCWTLRLVATHGEATW
jgi:hypothetical protein